MSDQEPPTKKQKTFSPDQTESFLRSKNVEKRKTALLYLLDDSITRPSLPKFLEELLVKLGSLSEDDDELKLILQYVSKSNENSNMFTEMLVCIGKKSTNEEICNYICLMAHRVPPNFPGALDMFNHLAEMARDKQQTAEFFVRGLFRSVEDNAHIAPFLTETMLDVVVRVGMNSNDQNILKSIIKLFGFQSRLNSERMGKAENIRDLLVYLGSQEEHKEFSFDVLLIIRNFLENENTRNNYRTEEVKNMIVFICQQFSNPDRDVFASLLKSSLEIMEQLVSDSDEEGILLFADDSVYEIILLCLDKVKFDVVCKTLSTFCKTKLKQPKMLFATVEIRNYLNDNGLLLVEEEEIIELLTLIIYLCDDNDDGKRVFLDDRIRNLFLEYAKRPNIAPRVLHATKKIHSLQFSSNIFSLDQAFQTMIVNVAHSSTFTKKEYICREILDLFYHFCFCNYDAKLFNGTQSVVTIFLSFYYHFPVLTTQLCKTIDVMMSDNFQFEDCLPIRTQQKNISESIHFSRYVQNKPFPIMTIQGIQKIMTETPNANYRAELIRINLAKTIQSRLTEFAEYIRRDSEALRTDQATPNINFDYDDDGGVANDVLFEEINENELVLAFSSFSSNLGIIKVEHGSVYNVSNTSDDAFWKQALTKFPVTTSQSLIVSVQVYHAVYRKKRPENAGHTESSFGRNHLISLESFISRYGKKRTKATKKYIMALIQSKQGSVSKGHFNKKKI